MESSLFSVAVRSERKRLELSLSECAELVGCSLATLKRWESGSAVPSSSQRELTLAALQTGHQVDFSPNRCHPGWWLRVVRIQQRLSLREASARAGLTSSTWHRYETGESRLSVGLAHELAHHIGLPTQGRLIQDKPLEYLIQRSQLAVSRGANDLFRLTFSACLATESNRHELSVDEYQSRLARTHATLGKALLQIGDFDLSGRAFRVAIKYGKPKDFTHINHSVAAFYSGWVGFGVSEPVWKSFERFRWLSARLSNVAPAVQARFAMPLCILVDRAGRPDLARDILNHGSIHCSEEEFLDYCKLTHAWLDVKHGVPERGLRVVENFLESADQDLRFSALKLRFDAYKAMRCQNSAECSLDELVQFEDRHEMRAISIPTRVRKQFGQ